MGAGLRAVLSGFFQTPFRWTWNSGHQKCSVHGASNSEACELMFLQVPAAHGFTSLRYPLALIKRMLQEDPAKVSTPDLLPITAYCETLCN
jgi:hypothetical protein